MRNGVNKTADRGRVLFHDIWGEDLLSVHIHTQHRLRWQLLCLLHPHKNTKTDCSKNQEKFVQMRVWNQQVLVLQKVYMSLGDLKILIYSFCRNQINRRKCWGPDTSLDTKPSQIILCHISMSFASFDIKWHYCSIAQIKPSMSLIPLENEQI